MPKVYIAKIQRDLDICDFFIRGAEKIIPDK